MKSSSLTQLRGVAWDHTRGYDPMVATAEAYRRQHPDTRIIWEKRSLHDFAYADVKELAARYELVVLDHPWVGFMAEHGGYRALDELLPGRTLEELAARSVGRSHRSYQWADHQWALAIDAATPSASYRPDLLAALGGAVPTTWSQVLELGELARSAGRWLVVPLVPVDAITVFLSLADNLGGRPFAEGPRVVDREVGREVLEAVRRLLRFCPEEVFEMSPITMMDRMSRDDDLVYCPLAYSYSNYSRDGYRPHLCLYADMPALGDAGPRGSHIGGTGLGISSHCRHPELAADYAAQVAGADWQRTIYFDAGGQPGHAAAWEDDRVNRVAHDFFRNTRQTIEQAFLRPRYDGYIRFQDEAGEVLSRHWREDGDPSVALGRLDELYRRDLEAAHKETIS